MATASKHTYSQEVLAEFEIVGLQKHVFKIQVSGFGVIDFRSLSLEQARKLHGQKLKYLKKKVIQTKVKPKAKLESA